MAHRTHAQDTLDMLPTEMDEAMKIAIKSQQTSGWLMTYCTNEMVGGALTLMVAGKFNWYTTNHYQGTICPFMSTNENNISETAKSTVWEISHWVSTHL